MAFASTVDTRPSAVGNLLMLTGTYTNGGSDTGGNIDLSSQLSSIVVAGANAGSSTAGTGAGVDGTFALLNGTTLVIQCVAGQDGTWYAMGLRN